MRARIALCVLVCGTIGGTAAAKKAKRKVPPAAPTMKVLKSKDTTLKERPAAVAATRPSELGVDAKQALFAQAYVGDGKPAPKKNVKPTKTIGLTPARPKQGDAWITLWSPSTFDPGDDLALFKNETDGSAEVVLDAAGTGTLLVFDCKVEAPKGTEFVVDLSPGKDTMTAQDGHLYASYRTESNAAIIDIQPVDGSKTTWKFFGCQIDELP